MEKIYLNWILCFWGLVALSLIFKIIMGWEKINKTYLYVLFVKTLSMPYLFLWWVTKPIHQPIKTTLKYVLGEDIIMSGLIVDITEESELIYWDNYPNPVSGDEYTYKRYFCTVNLMPENLFNNIFSFEINGRKIDIEKEKGISLLSKVKIKCRKWGDNNIYFRKVLYVEKIN